MANHPTRDRITLTGPYSTAPTWRRPGKDMEPLGKYAEWMFGKHSAHISRVSPQWEPLAGIYLGGILARHRRTGALVEICGDRICSINPRKATAALAALSEVDHAAPAR